MKGPKIASRTIFILECFGAVLVPGLYSQVLNPFIPTQTHNAAAMAGVAGTPHEIAGSGGTAQQLGPQKAGVFLNGVWYLDTNGTTFWDAGDKVIGWGWSDSIPVVGDWNGDGHTKVGVYHQGNWYLDMNGNGVWDAADMAFGWGWADSVPVVGDWNGDGRTKVGVYQHGVWYLDMNGSGYWEAGDMAFAWGGADSVPVVGDWSGNGRTKIGVYHQGAWYLDADGSGGWTIGDLAFTWGSSTSTPVVGDWNGNGKTKVGIFEEGVWYLDINGNTYWDTGDVRSDWDYGNAMSSQFHPVIGDWNGDGIDDLGLVGNGEWIIDSNGNWLRQWQVAGEIDKRFIWGALQGKAVVGRW